MVLGKALTRVFNLPIWGDSRHLHIAIMFCPLVPVLSSMFTIFHRSKSHVVNTVLISIRLTSVNDVGATSELDGSVRWRF